jgi:phospholipid/cholesterol/gamma-HCH transport system ATP-binding protein
MTADANAAPLPAGPSAEAPVVRISDLHVSFDGRSILRGIDLVVPRGETLVILGGSGCGKTTLLHCLTGAVRPDRGTVEVLGRPVAALAGAALDAHRVQVGFLFQHGALFESMTVRENIACVLREHTPLTAEEIEILIAMKLELVGLRHATDLLPAQLSGGMRKRVALARALSLDPPLMLYDEPGAGLDPISLAAVDRIIETLARVLGMTSLVVTHHIESALRIADRVIFLHGGQIVAEGPPETLEEHPDPRLRQFLEGSAEGPLSDPAQAEDFAISLLGKEHAS